MTGKPASIALVLTLSIDGSSKPGDFVKVK